MKKLGRWDALIRDYELKFGKNDVSDKMRRAALSAVAPEAVVENRLAGRRDLDKYANVRCMIDDMIRREAIKIDRRRRSTVAGRRPVEAQRDNVGLCERSERRRE